MKTMKLELLIQNDTACVGVELIEPHLITKATEETLIEQRIEKKLDACIVILKELKD